VVSKRRTTQGRESTTSRPGSNLALRESLSTAAPFAESVAVWVWMLTVFEIAFLALAMLARNCYYSDVETRHVTTSGFESAFRAS
jgi:hypothetical protein